jgi:hypothetical protein
MARPEDAHEDHRQGDAQQCNAVSLDEIWAPAIHNLFFNAAITGIMT